MSNNNRETLKGFFKANCVPTAGQFAFLIDGMLNQKDDGLFRLNDGPLSIKAGGDAKQAQTLLNFLESGQDDSPAWKLQLNLTSGSTVQAGFSISDEKQGDSRLFIDRTSGNIGMGTTLPKAILDIAGVLRIGSNENGTGPKSISFYTKAEDVVDAAKIIYKGDLGSDALNIVGAGKTTNDRTINLFDQVKVHGNLAVTKKVTLAGGLRVTGNTTIQGSVGIGTDNPTGKLDIAGVLCIGPSGQKSISFARESSDDVNTGIIIYKGGVASDSALSLYGAGLTNGTEKNIKLYGNVEINGGLNVKGDMIRNVVRATNNTIITLKREDIKAREYYPISRQLKFTKHHDGTAIRIVYSDHVKVQRTSDSNYPFFYLVICIDNDHKSNIIGVFYKISMVNSIHPVNIIGLQQYLKKGDHRIDVFFFMPDIDRQFCPENVVFGDTDKPWTIEVEEVWL